MRNISLPKLFLTLLVVIGTQVHPHLLTADTLDVCINEIAWMGTEASSSDEWIELYNNTNNDIDLTNYKLVAADGSPEITLSDTIKANSYFLLERSDETTIADIDCDFIYTGSLGNTGENLILKDSTDTVIDQVDCSNGWFAGDNSNRISMERISPIASGSDSANWNSNNCIKINGKDADMTAIKGTPGKQNSVYESQASMEQFLHSPVRTHTIYNYPNPFNPSTKIYFDLSSENYGELVTIQIFNLKGQKVRTLIREKLVKGDNSIVWDGLDDSGRDLPSGIYFLYLYNENKIIDTAKMLKVK